MSGHLILQYSVFDIHLQGEVITLLLRSEMRQFCSRYSSQNSHVKFRANRLATVPLKGS